eukprot:8520354-Karenia_brevis.AAC.1
MGPAQRRREFGEKLVRSGFPVINSRSHGWSITRTQLLDTEDQPAYDTIIKASEKHLNMTPE